MNCRQFEGLLPEWAAERLSPEQAQRMEAHQARCARCAQSAQQERALRQQWQALPASESLPALWPRLSPRLVPISGKPRSLPPAIWALTSLALAAGGFGLLTWQRSLPLASPVPVATIQPRENVDEQHLVQMVSDIQNLPDTESEVFAAEAQQERRTQQRLLLGGKSQ